MTQSVSHKRFLKFKICKNYTFRYWTTRTSPCYYYYYYYKF